MTNKKKHTPVIPRIVTGAFLRILQFLAVSAGIYAWWVAMFLLVSLITVNVWSVTWTQILLRSLWLTVACSLVYLLVMIHRERKKQEDAS